MQPGNLKKQQAPETRQAPRMDRGCGISTLSTGISELSHSRDAQWG